MKDNVTDRISKASLGKLLTALETGRPDSFMRTLRTFFSSVVFHMAGDLERHYQNVMYVICRLLGVWSQVEVCTAGGRFDMLAGSGPYRYIFEFKLNHPVSEAQQQIFDKEYTTPYMDGNGKVFSLAVTFKNKNIGSWIITEFPNKRMA